METTRREFLKAAGPGVAALTFLPHWMVQAADNEPATPDGLFQVLLPNADVPWACRVERTKNPLPERFPFRPKMRVTRSLDLLDLVFEWTNVEAVPPKTHDGPLFIRKKPGPAFLTVWFPPQSLLEQAYLDPPGDFVGKLGDFKPVNARWGGATRLVFAIPEIYEKKLLPYDFATLLNWQELLPSVTPHALPPDYPVTARAEPRELKSTETAIELPWGMILSPDASEGWEHKSDPIPILKDFTSSRAPVKVELWHTQLRRNADPTRPNVPLSVRVVWSRDEEPQGLKPLPNCKKRRSLVQETANFNLRYDDGHPFLTRHVGVKRLLLSSEGAYAKLKAGWPFQELQNITGPAGISLDIDEWIEETVWGRRQYAEVSTLGYCMPFGHVVSSVTEQRREFRDFDDGTPVAKLEEYQFCVVRQPVIEYERPPEGAPGESRGCCFRRVEISPERTPYLSDTPENTKGWMILRGFDGSQDAHIFKFKITAWDWDGNRTEFEMPLLWATKDVSEKGGIDLDNLVKFYKANQTRRTTTLASQKVAFAPSDETNSRDVGVETSSIVFYVSKEKDFFPHGWIPRFYPSVDEATIRLAQTAAFDTAGAGGKSILKYNGEYLKAGFRHIGGDGKVANGTEVFADISAVAGAEPPSLTFPGDKSGGLTTPSLAAIVHLSRVFGPVGGPKPDKNKAANQQSALVKGTFNPAEFLGTAARLIGGVNLADVVEAVTEAYDEIARVPKLVAETINEIKGQVEEVRKVVEEIRAALQVIDNLRQGKLSEVIREQVTKLVVGEAEKVKKELAAFILQEARDYQGALRAMQMAAETAFDGILTTGVTTAAEKFSQYFGKPFDGHEDQFFVLILTTVREAQDLQKTIETALDTVDEYRKLAPNLKQEASRRITAYVQSPEFSAALGVGKFKKQLENYAEKILDPLLRNLAPVTGVAEAILAEAIKHPDVIAELMVAWDKPEEVRKRIQEKVQSTLTQLTQPQRDDISKKVEVYFKDVDVSKLLAVYNTSLLQFRDHICAEIKRLGLADAKEQIAYIKGLLDPLKMREIFETALGCIDGVVNSVRELPLGPLKNIIADFHRLQEDFKDPAKQLLNGELNRTVNQLGQGIEDLIKQGLTNSAKTVMAQTTAKLGDVAKTKFEEHFKKQIDDLKTAAGKVTKKEIQDEIVAFVDTKIGPLATAANDYAQAIIKVSQGWMEDANELLVHINEVAGAIMKPLQTIMDAVKLVQELIHKAEEVIPKELAVDYAWQPGLKSSGAFEARRNAIPATFKLHARIRKSLLPAELAKPPEVRVDGQLRDFTLRLLPSTCFIIVAFKEVSFLSENGATPTVSVKLDRVTFGAALQFVQELAKALSPDSGFFIELAGLGLEAGYRFALPNITTGGFNLVQVSINTSVILPFDGSEVRVKFSLCDRQRPFLLTVGILGGGGFFGITLNSKGVQTLEGSLEFGAVIALDICVATGIVAVTAGIYFCQSGDDASLYGFVRATGSLRVIGMITVSVQFYLGLGYEKRDGKTLAVGEAILTVEIEMLFFSVSVDLHYRKEFEGSSEGGQSRVMKGLVAGGGALPEGSSERTREYLAFKKNWRKYRSSYFSWSTANPKSEEIGL